MTGWMFFLLTERSTYITHLDVIVIVRHKHVWNTNAGCLFPYSTHDICTNVHLHTSHSHSPLQHADDDVRELFAADNSTLRIFWIVVQSVSQFFGSWLKMCCFLNNTKDSTFNQNTHKNLIKLHTQISRMIGCTVCVPQAQAISIHSLDLLIFPSLYFSRVECTWRACAHRSNIEAYAGAECFASVVAQVIVYSWLCMRFGGDLRTYTERSPHY